MRHYLLFATMALLVSQLQAIPAHADPFVFPRPRHDTAYLRSSKANEIAPSGKTYLTANKFNWALSFNYPDNWQFQDGGDYVYLELADGMNLESFRKSNIVVMMKKIPKEMPLETVDNEFIAGAKVDPVTSAFRDSIIPSFSLISSGSTVLMGHPALSYVFTCDNSNAMTKAHLVVTSFDHTWIQAYVLSPPAYFGVDDSVFNHVIATLNIAAASSRPGIVERQLTKWAASSSSSKAILKPVTVKRPTYSSLRKK